MSCLQDISRAAPYGPYLQKLQSSLNNEHQQHEEQPISSRRTKLHDYQIDLLGDRQ